jgi:serine/threonine protein kinase
MTDEGHSGSSDPVSSAIQSQHPRIAEEIEGAIKTLHKLKKLADPDSPGAKAVPADSGGANLATIEMTSASAALSSAALAAGGRTIAATQAEPEVGLGAAPILAASTTFGRYQIIRLLGKGAMGAVYLAYDTQLHRHVALKTPSLGDNPTVIERFHREARAAAQLRSPYLCPIYDVGQIGRVYYLSMAFIEGQPLSQAVAEGLFPTMGEITTVIKKIARGLQKAHESGIIHRDLKPDNIMIDQDREPIVMDFGLAKSINDNAQVTMSGVIIGTPAYMSPEQVEGDPKLLGPPTDIYSLGVVFYQMLTGRLPFQGSLTAILRQIGCERPPLPSALNLGIGENSSIEKICVKMMAKSLDERYQSMAQVVAALDALSPQEAAPIVKRSAFDRIKSWPSGIFSSLARPGKASKSDGGNSTPKPAIDPNQQTMADP